MDLLRTDDGAVVWSDQYEDTSGDVLAVEDEVARRVAQVMFDVPLEEISEADMHDAIGEVTNMTAGNVKAFVEGYCRLSLPTVTGGVNMSISMPGSRIIAVTAFDCGDEAFSVVLVERA